MANSSFYSDSRPASTRLPIEIVHYIFKLAAPSSLRVAFALTRVARWPRSIALPHLWSTVVVRDVKETRRSNLGAGLVIQSACSAMSLISREWEWITICVPDMTKVWDLPSGAEKHIHSVFFMPRLETCFSELDPMTWFVIKALPKLRRLAISSDELRNILMTRSERFDPVPISQFRLREEVASIPELFIWGKVSDDQVLALMRLRGRSVSFPVARAPIDCRFSRNIDLQTLTHVRIGEPSGTWQDATQLDALLPAVTHFAFSVSPGPGIAALSPPYFWTDTFLNSPKLKLLLVLGRGIDQDVQSIWQYALSKLERIASDGRVQGQIIVMSICKDPKDDWRLWEDLARENLNIWDAAVGMRQADEERAAAAAAAAAAASGTSDNGGES